MRQKNHAYKASFIRSDTKYINYPFTKIRFQLYLFCHGKIEHPPQFRRRNKFEKIHCG